LRPGPTGHIATDPASAGQAKGGVIGCTKSVIRKLGVSGAIWLLVSTTRE
jgi:hypothetical protein